MLAFVEAGICVLICSKRDRVGAGSPTLSFFLCQRVSGWCIEGCGAHCSEGVTAAGGIPRSCPISVARTDSAHSSYDMHRGWAKLDPHIGNPPNITERAGTRYHFAHVALGTVSPRCQSAPSYSLFGYASYCYRPCAAFQRAVVNCESDASCSICQAPTPPMFTPLPSGKVMLFANKARWVFSRMHSGSVHHMIASTVFFWLAFGVIVSTNRFSRQYSFVALVAMNCR